MKRGRPNLRRIVQKEIIVILEKLSTPTTIAVISKEISKTLNRRISWNTVQKYIQELVESGKVQAIQLPHSKIENKSGLVVYTLKK
ncbi:MAG: hypothetical protein QW818_02855 [Candidatus Aenigmatarchaeota archaeon]|nr:hypothetical protein [Candidatus Aenigmarchaeota archaeon]